MKIDSINILIVEDDAPIRNLISTTLMANKYNYELAINGNEALRKVTSSKVDIVLLDLGLPDMDGVDVITQIRGFSMLPIIVISARTDDEDKIEALDAGADDYLTKPFSVEELLARLRSTIRRLDYLNTVKESESSNFINGELRIEYESATVFVNDEEIHLMPIEYSLLCLLAKNVGKVLTYQYILDKVWVNTIESDLSSLRVYMASLRKKIEKRSSLVNKYIQTHIGIGYRMIKVK